MFSILKFIGKKQEFTNIGEPTGETTVKLDNITESLGNKTKQDTKGSFRRSLSIQEILKTKPKNTQPPINQPTPSTPRTTTRATSVEFKLDQYTASTAFLNRLLEYYDEKNNEQKSINTYVIVIKHQ